MHNTLKNYQGSACGLNFLLSMANCTSPCDWASWAVQHMSLILEFLFAIPFPTDHFFAFQRKLGLFPQMSTGGESKSLKYWSNISCIMISAAVQSKWPSIINSLVLTFTSFTISSYCGIHVDATCISKEIFIVSYQLIIRPLHFIEVLPRVSNL